MKKNYLKKLGTMALAVSAGICLNLPVLASDSTARSPEIYAQSSSGQGSSGQGSSGQGSSSQGSSGQSSSGQGYSGRGYSQDFPTGQKDTQAVRDPNVIPGGWLCLNNPNPQGNSQCRR